MKVLLVVALAFVVLGTVFAVDQCSIDPDCDQPDQPLSCDSTSRRGCHNHVCTCVIADLRCEHDYQCPPCHNQHDKSKCHNHRCSTCSHHD